MSGNIGSGGEGNHSYGRKSPFMNTDNNAWNVASSGVVDDSYGI